MQVRASPILRTSCDDVESEDVGFEELVQGILVGNRARTISRGHIGEFLAIRTVLADVVDPRLPLVVAHIAQRTSDLRVLLGRVDHGQHAGEVAGLDETAEQGERTAFSGIGRFHEAGVAAGDFGTVYAADARGIGYALRPVVFAVGVLLLPCCGVVAPDMAAAVTSRIAAGHAAACGRIRCRLCAHRAAAHCGIGRAVANRRHEVLHEREQVVEVDELLEHAAVAEYVCHGSRLHGAHVAAGRNLADDVYELMRARVLDMAAFDVSGEAAGHTQWIGLVVGVPMVCRAGQHGVSADAAGHIGMFNRRDDDIQHTEYIVEIDVLAEQAQAAAHGRRRADVHFADVAAGIPSGGDCIRAVFAQIGVVDGSGGFQILRCLDISTAQLGHTGMGHLHTGTVSNVAAGGTGLRIGLIKSGGGNGEAGIIRVGNLVTASCLHGGGIGMHTRVGDERHIALHHLQQVGEIHRTEFAEQTQAAVASRSERAGNDLAAETTCVCAAGHMVKVDNGHGVGLNAGLHVCQR